jgi:hypothetical protein
MKIVVFMALQCDLDLSQTDRIHRANAALGGIMNYEV